jgi:hypothetical protein
VIGVYQDPCFLLIEIGRTDLLLLFVVRAGGGKLG